jgi:putative acetyltransferase
MTAAATTVRRYLAADRTFVANLLRDAFGASAEAKLVARLRAEPAMAFELVAEDAAGTVLGHIAFSRLSVIGEGGRSLDAVALAPLAVAPDRQRHGIGSSLVRAGIEECRKQGAALIVVLGDPAYYGRFGFSAAVATRLRAPYSGGGFMALELQSGALGDAEWAVVYPRAFAEIG